MELKSLYLYHDYHANLTTKYLTNLSTCLCFPRPQYRLLLPEKLWKSPPPSPAPLPTLYSSHSSQRFIFLECRYDFVDSLLKALRWLLISLKTNSNLFNIPTKLCTGVCYHFSSTPVHPTLLLLSGSQVPSLLPVLC